VPAFSVVVPVVLPVVVPVVLPVVFSCDVPVIVPVPVAVPVEVPVWARAETDNTRTAVKIDLIIENSPYGFLMSYLQKQEGCRASFVLD
jgi:hypothetical protein